MKIPLKKENEIHLVSVDDIKYLDIYKKIISVHTEDEIYQTLFTLSDWHSFLSQYGYAMVNQSTIVNMSKIESFDKELNMVIFKKGNSVGVSRTNVKKIRNYIKNNTPGK